MRAPTGQQFTISSGSSRAIITELAAGLREFSVGGEHIAEPFGEFSTPPMGCGIVLVPWPNRVAGGAWMLNGKKQQLDLTDPGFLGASHGLLRNSPYRVASHDESSITLAATVFPQHGYPFLLETAVRYELVGETLSVTHDIRNDSDAAAPVAVGAHPYFRIGSVPTEELTLSVQGSTRFTLDEKLIPVDEVPVDGDFDLRGGRLLGEVDLNVALGGLPAGTTESVLTAPDGRSVTVWQDDNFRFVQVYTPRNFPAAEGERLAVAIEPMTAAPDALNNGKGLRWVEPGESFTASWGVRYEH